VDLDEAVDLLYGLDPAEFTARRDALAAEARTSGDRPLAAAIKSLRRPSVAAHAVNLLARESGDQVAKLIDLGQRLQQAQEALSAEEMRALGRQRHQLIAGMAQQAGSLARGGGHPVSEAALREVEATLEAALGDDGAASAVRQGRLLRSLSRTGLDPVDLTGAVAVRPGDAASTGAGSGKGSTAGKAPRPSARRPPSPDDDGGRDAGRAAAEEEKARKEAELAEARSAAEWARAVMRREQEGLARCDESMAAATAAREAADGEVEALQEQLAAARGKAETAADEERRARRARADAATDAESAGAAAQRAEERVASLEGSG
jgi:hypothetical protein